MSVLKLFISHSSKSNHQKLLLKKVCTALDDDENYTVLVDQNGQIPIGGDWFQYLAEWMAECDAAIILFSKEAMDESQWVRAETAILSWRKRVQPEFKLFAVLLDGVTPEKFKNDSFYDVIRFGDFQHIGDCRYADDTEVIKKIKNALGQSDVNPSPFQELITKISENLSTVENKTLKRVYEELEIECDNPKSLCLKYSDALARLMFRDPDESLIVLRKIIGKLKHIPNFEENANILTKMLMGMWVSSKAAAQLALSEKESQKTFLLNADEAQEFTAPCYVRRTWPCAEKFKIVPATGCNTLKEINNALIKSFPNVSEKLAVKRLKNYVDPLILLFPSNDSSINGYPDQFLINDIQSAFPNVVILIATGTQIPQELTIYATPIKPLIESEIEYDRYGQYDDIMELIRA